MPAILIGETRLGVEEMVVDGQRQVGHVLIVYTVAVVAHIAILQVGIEAETLLPAVEHTPIDFAVGVRVHLVGVVAIVLVVNGQAPAIDAVLDVV